MGRNDIGLRLGHVCVATDCWWFALVFLAALPISATQAATNKTKNESFFAGEGFEKRKPIKHQTSEGAQSQRAGEDFLGTAKRLRLEWTAESLRMALEKYRSAMAAFKETGDKAGEAQARLGAGEVLGILGEQGESLSQYWRALRLVSTRGDKKLEVDILNRVTEIEINQRDRAYEMHAQRSLALAEKAAYPVGLAGALNNLGMIAYINNDSAKAIDHFNRALSLWSNEGNLAGQAEALTSLGLTYGDSGNMDRAQEIFDRALACSRAAGDRRKEARISLAVALVHSERGEWQKAIDLYRRTVSLLRQFGDKVTLVVALNGLGFLYEELGDMSQSLANFTESLALSKRMGHKGNEALALRHIASAYADAGYAQEALGVYRRLIQITQSLRDARIETYALTDIGLIYESLGNLKRARGCYDRAVAIGQLLHPRAQAYSLTRLGVLYLRMNKPKKARSHQEAALLLMKQSGDRAGEALVLYNIARLKQQQGDIESALLDTQKIIQASEAERSEILSSDLKVSHLASTYRTYELLIDLLMQKHAREPAAGHDVAAFEASEVGRARSLTEMLTQSRANLREGVPAELLERESRALVMLRKKAAEEMALRETRFKLSQTRLPVGENRAEKLSQNSHELESVSHQITDLTAQLDQATTEIKANRPKKYASLLRAPLISLKQLQEKLLDAETLVLEYSLGEERSYLWTIGPNSLTSSVLPGKAQIESEAYAFYKALTSVSKDRTDSARPRRSQTKLGDFSAARDRLSRTLLAPIKGIAGSKRLVIVADGALQYVPFGALIEPGPNQPLVIGHELASLPSLSVLFEMREEISSRTIAPKALSVFADPVVEERDPRFSGKQGEPASRSRRPASGTSRSLSALGGVRSPFNPSAQVEEGVNFARLPFAAEEAAMLAAMVKGSDVLVRTGFEANRQTAISEDLSRFRIIHFATHGILDFRHPNLSCLLLSCFDQNRQPQDGYLRLQDVYNMKLSADLVVLSACQTALGKEVRGEGLVGLTRGFLYAGAARVVASLWNVDDNASGKLMERFYRKMLGPEKLRPSAALHAAQIEMMREKRWSDPYFWAAFILQGEWK